MDYEYYPTITQIKITPSCWNNLNKTWNKTSITITLPILSIICSENLNVQLLVITTHKSLINFIKKKNPSLICGQNRKDFPIRKSNSPMHACSTCFISSFQFPNVHESWLMSANEKVSYILAKESTWHWESIQNFIIISHIPNNIIWQHQR